MVRNIQCLLTQKFYGSSKLRYVSSMWVDLSCLLFKKNGAVKKVILHIGQHKTGTTSTQNFVAKLKGFFIRRSVYYPSDIGGMGGSNHYALNIVCLGEGRFSSQKDLFLQGESGSIAGLRERVKADLKQVFHEATQTGCSTVLLSNEGLYLLRSKREYQSLKALFESFGVDVEIVCCFRDLSSYRESYRKQLVKQKISTNQDIDSYRYVEDDSWLFDYSEKRSVLESVFSKVHYFEYSGLDNISSFLTVIGVKHPFVRFPRNNTTKV